MRGSYVLFIKLKRDSKIRIGKFGLIDFPKGFYCYVGSAMGKSVNLENRLKRHFRKNKRKKWHIDYLLSHPFASLEGAITFSSRKKLECFIAQAIEKQADFTVDNFGSSDCGCKGHLHYFKTGKSAIHAVNKVEI